MLRCPVCGGLIIVTSGIRSRVYDGTGRAIVYQDNKPSLYKVFCEDCFILFHPRVLGKFKFISEKPYWKKCGKGG